MAARDHKSLLTSLKGVLGRLSADSDEAERVATALALVGDRLVALAVGEKADSALFLSDSQRDAKYFRTRTRARKGSLASQIGVPARALMTQGKVVAASGSRKLLQGVLANEAPGGADRCSRALFVWHGGVYTPARQTEADSRLNERVGRVAQLVGRRKDGASAVSSWGLLSRAASRQGHRNGYLVPFGRGMRMHDTPPADRPCISAATAACLTSFFHDEPLSQSYTRNVWLLIGPRRLFAALPAKGAWDTRQWLHFSDEPFRLAGLKDAYARLLKRNRRVSKAGKRRPREMRQLRLTKTISFQDLYDLLERILERHDARDAS